MSKYESVWYSGFQWMSLWRSDKILLTLSVYWLLVQGMVQTMSPSESQNHALRPKALAPQAMHGFEIPVGSSLEAMPRTPYSVRKYLRNHETCSTDLKISKEI